MPTRSRDPDGTNQKSLMLVFLAAWVYTIFDSAVINEHILKNELEPNCTCIIFHQNIFHWIWLELLIFIISGSCNVIMSTIPSSVVDKLCVYIVILLFKWYKLQPLTINITFELPYELLYTGNTTKNKMFKYWHFIN